MRTRCMCTKQTRQSSLYLLSLFQPYAEEEGQKQLVLFKQRATDVLVDAVSKVVVQIPYSRVEVLRRFRIDDGLKHTRKNIR